MRFFRNLFNSNSGNNISNSSNSSEQITAPNVAQRSSRPLIDPDVLRLILPNCRNPIAWAQILSEVLPRYGITDRLALASFISQCAVESGQFNVLEENLNYSAEGLMSTWPSRFPTKEIADAYARNPRMIANKVYANRMGNGPESSGDGWKYRGRGLIQVTGKNNYTACSRFMFNDLRLLDTPELLSATNRNAAESACWFWVTNNLNQYTGDVDRTTRIINRGTHGINERRRLYNLALTYLP